MGSTIIATVLPSQIEHWWQGGHILVNLQCFSQSADIHCTEPRNIKLGEQELPTILDTRGTAWHSARPRSIMLKCGHIDVTRYVVGDGIGDGETNMESGCHYVHDILEVSLDDGELVICQVFQHNLTRRIYDGGTW